jgi:hypothetical protein
MSIPPNGTLVKATGTSAVYLIVFGQRCWVPSPETFDNLFLDWNLVHEISGAEFYGISEGAPLTEDAYLLGLEGVNYASCFFCWGRLNGIPSEEVFNQFGFNPQKIHWVTLPPPDAAGLVDGHGWTLTP